MNDIINLKTNENVALIKKDHNFFNSDIPPLDYSTKYLVTGTWHKTRFYDVRTGNIINDKTIQSIYSTVYVSGMITGCGIAQLHGIINLNSDLNNASSFNISKKIIENIIEDYKEDGAGCIIATLGEDYYKYESLLKALGFDILIEYINYRHGDNYKQTLYSLTY